MNKGKINESQTDADEGKTPRKWPFFVIVGALLAAAVALSLLIGIPLVRFASQPEAFRVWIDDLGAWGYLAYVALVMVQIVVAFIPGEPLEIVAGYAYGPVLGTVLCMLAEALGTILVMLLVRKLGRRLVEYFFSREKIESMRFLRASDRKELLLMLLFILPGTPKDLLCYYAGLTDIKMWKLILIGCLCRFPSVFTSVLGGAAIGEKNYVRAVIVFAATGVVCLVSWLFFRHLSRRRETGRDEEKKDNTEQNSGN